MRNPSNSQLVCYVHFAVARLGNIISALSFCNPVSEFYSEFQKVKKAAGKRSSMFPKNAWLIYEFTGLFQSLMACSVKALSRDFNGLLSVPHLLLCGTALQDIGYHGPPQLPIPCGAKHFLSLC